MRIMRHARKGKLSLGSHSYFLSIDVTGLLGYVSDTQFVIFSYAIECVSGVVSSIAWVLRSLGRIFWFAKRLGVE